jgi:hypothetical protein
LEIIEIVIQKASICLMEKFYFFCALEILFSNKASRKMKDDLQQYSVWKFDLSMMFIAGLISLSTLL